MSPDFDVLGAILQISLIDLLLSGDNAIVIALACQQLPAALRQRALLLGTAAAVFFRVLLTFAAGLALRAPFLKLVGALLLVLIAIEMIAGEDRSAQRSAQRSTQRGDPAARQAASGLWKAIATIVLADAVMSLDNVVAVAAAAQDNLALLVLGLVISVPVLVTSSLWLVRALDAHPFLIDAGAALLGWIAGRTAVSDPFIAADLEAQSFGLVALAPLLGATYVVIQGRRLRRQRSGASLPALARGEASLDPVLVSSGELTAGRAAGSSVGAPAAAAPIDQPPQPARQARFSTMDLTIMAGAAVPVLGLVATIVYMVAKAIARH